MKIFILKNNLIKIFFYNVNYLIRILKKFTCDFYLILNKNSINISTKIKFLAKFKI